MSSTTPGKTAPPLWPALGWETVKIVAYNTAIAVMFTVLARGHWWSNLVYSQAMGLSIFAAVRGCCALRKRCRPGWLDAIIGIPLGFALGISIGTIANGLNPILVLEQYPRLFLGAALTALIFGAIATYHFYSQARLQEAESQAKSERLRRLEQEAATTHTELALLQAQIEPHFLFNTLSNVVSLIDEQPAAARSMLLNLTALLRTSLARTRRGQVTLAEELDLLRAYLQIMAIRMGPRLSFEIEAPDEVLHQHLPPLLVQPLVENALRHGLEPLPEGGQLTVRCRRQADSLVIEVVDSGKGFGSEGPHGLGLSNVRQRLESCYGQAAGLSLLSNVHGGVTACLRLPWQASGIATEAQQA